MFLRHPAYNSAVKFIIGLYIRFGKGDLLIGYLRKWFGDVGEIGALACL